MDSLTPKQAIEILAKHGTIITVTEAEKVLEFFQLLAELTLDQYEENEEGQMG